MAKEGKAHGERRKRGDQRRRPDAFLRRREDAPTAPRPAAARLHYRPSPHAAARAPGAFWTAFLAGNGQRLLKRGRKPQRTAAPEAGPIAPSLAPAAATEPGAESLPETVAVPMGEPAATPAGEPVGEPVGEPLPALLAPPLDQDAPAPTIEPGFASVDEPAGAPTATTPADPAGTPAEPVTEPTAEPLPALLAPPAAAAPKPRHRRRWRLAIGLLLIAALLTAAIVAARREMNESPLQARWLAGIGRHIAFAPAPGANPDIRYPGDGPYDQRLGYSQLPGYLKRLQGQDYAVTTQARSSAQLVEAIDHGLFTPYREKSQAGLTILERYGRPLFAARYPERVYTRMEDVPPILVQALLFTENRELLTPQAPTSNPAVEWDRLAWAVAARIGRVIDSDLDAPGGSTLATQIEKYRHSPGGRTDSAGEKLRQMASASLRVYLDGEDTRPARRRIVVDYLNTVPLSAKPGYGEVNGLGDGLWAWYGRDFAEVNRLLAGRGHEPARALAFKQALSLIISQRRPSYYLGNAASRLESLTDSYLRILAAQGVIAPALRDAALAQRLVPGRLPPPPPAAFVEHKAANAIRIDLAGRLGIDKLYELDRLDLTAHSTLDGKLQQAVTEVLRGLRDPATARAAGLVGPRLLERGDPAKVIYSFVLFERGRDFNRVRVQTDNYDQPLDINEGTKLDLGSTAKLRTLVSYLDAVAELHARWSVLPAAELAKAGGDEPDMISRWARDWLARAPDRSLPAMLDGALERNYSASPAERFFTGGGMHTFENFKHEDDGRVMSVREALRNSVNLVFIRLMRDVVRYHMQQLTGSTATMLADVRDPRRQAYLARFADREGLVFLQRYQDKYRGLKPDQVDAMLVKSARQTPRALATIFRTLYPEADQAAMAAFLARYGAAASPQQLARLYEEQAPGKFDLGDRGYLARLHPLELWLAAYLKAHPQARWAELVKASAAERQDAYSWLFKPRQKRAQDSRIRQMLEADGFARLLKQWQRVGYPFDALVPSYATALGASADRPAALSELMGILLNDGLRLPSTRIERLHFAAATPYETALARQPALPQRVLPAEVARAAREALRAVVESGTASRLNGVFKDANGQPLAVGGKTGTGDHRYDTYGKGGVLLSSRVVSRSGTFVFYIGDRYFGTLTAHVRGRRRRGIALPVR
ncbi:transglycosylase domain-containing protein [Chitinimonas koreensis]|uniref:transglycosylase domain-containing protein n=1 Tax=Chitinimonas koreensis TaxID=356302 RepID=UPI00223F2AE6|nr:transglycosylase domain-containing protein [Chitinimonas koreensis]